MDGGDRKVIENATLELASRNTETQAPIEHKADDCPQVPKPQRSNMEDVSKGDAAAFVAANRTQGAATQNPVGTNENRQPGQSITIKVLCKPTGHMWKIKFDLGLGIQENLKKHERHFGIEVSDEWVLEEEDGCGVLETDLLECGAKYILKDTRSTAKLPPGDMHTPQNSKDVKGTFTALFGANFVYHGLTLFSCLFLPVKAERTVKAETTVTPMANLRNERRAKDIDPFDDLVSLLEDWIEEHGGEFVELNLKHDADKEEQILGNRLQKRRAQYDKGQLSEQNATRLRELGIDGFSLETKGKFKAKALEGTPRKAKRKGKSASFTIKNEYLQPHKKAKNANRVKLTDHRKLPKNMLPGDIKIDCNPNRLVYCTKEGDTITKIAKLFYTRPDIDRILSDNAFLTEEGELPADGYLENSICVVLYTSPK